MSVMREIKSLILKKIIDPEKIEILVKKVRSEKQLIVFTNGCFDIIHRGHIEYLAKAKQLGDILIVAINSDNSVRKLKGDKRPINRLNDRLYCIASLFFVDYVTYFDEMTPINLINVIKPDIHVKGGDYKVEELPEYQVVRKYGGKIKIIDFINGYSTSNIINKINDKTD